MHCVITKDLRYHICYATGNALLQQETILCKFGQIRATGNAQIQLETILFKFEQICATGNVFKQLETIYASLDKSMQWQTFLCSWKQFMRVLTNLCNRKCSYAEESNFYEFEQICATGNAPMYLETISCEFGQICAATGNALKQL